jgi:hypothetical protein
LRLLWRGDDNWDHLRPLVKNKLPTGYISEIRNLVPSCGPCNQSKGASDWRAWMRGKARGSPTLDVVLDAMRAAQKRAAVVREEIMTVIAKSPEQ